MMAIHRTPQGSVVSPTLFSFMINYILMDIPEGIGRSLFANYGALWKSVENYKYIAKRMPDGISKVKRRRIKWGFNFSFEKKNVMF